jgi:hypothetical protein
MNSRHFLIASLLLSSFPYKIFCAENDALMDNDLAYIECRMELKALNEDVERLTLYVLASIVPCKSECTFDPHGRATKSTIKYLVRRFFIGDALDLEANLPSVGDVSILNTDQALELAYTVTHDLINKKSTSHIGIHAGKTFVREKVVEASLWVLEQIKIEGLLPDSVAGSPIYTETRNEVLRYYVDKLIEKALELRKV